MVTIVITTCKRNPEIIDRAIKSVICQTYTDWEMIVVDDSPNDWPLRQKVRETVTAYSANYPVSYIANATNRGACYSRNVGLYKAKGEFIAYLDDDDEWLPEKLEKQVEALSNADADTALVYGSFYIENEEKKERKFSERLLLSGFIYEDLMQKGNIIGGMSIPMMRTQCVIDVGGFDEQMPSVQDLDLWIRIAEKYKIISISCPLIVYHEYNGEQISNNPLKKTAGLERLCDKNREYLSQHKKADARFLRLISDHYAKAGMTKKALQFWGRAVMLRPGEMTNNMNCFRGILSNMTRSHSA